MRQLPERHPPLKQLIDMVRFVVGHVFHLEVQVVVRELRVLAPCGAIRRASALRAGGTALRARSRYSASTSAVGRLVSATNTSSPSGLSYGTMVVSSVSMRRETLAEDRLHPPEVTDQLLHRPLARARCASRAPLRPDPAASRCTSAACARRRWTSARCTACLSSHDRDDDAGSCRAL